MENGNIGSGKGEWVKNGKIVRKTKSLVKIIFRQRHTELEDEYEKFCEKLWSEGGIIKGCQFTTDMVDDLRYLNIAIYYEIEKDRLDRFKKEIQSL